MAEQQPFDVTKLRQRADVPRQRIGKRRKRRVYREPPRAQYKGPFTKGPRAYLVCSTCTVIFGTEENGIRAFAIPKQRAAQHLKDHQAGRVRRARS